MKTNSRPRTICFQPTPVVRSLLRKAVRHHCPYGTTPRGVLTRVINAACAAQFAAYAGKRDLP